VEALSGVEKKNINGRLTCRGLNKNLRFSSLPWPGKNIRLASFANAWQDFLLIHKIVDVFLFVFGPGLRRT
jgi:hypothetical protein